MFRLASSSLNPAKVRSDVPIVKITEASPFLEASLRALCAPQKSPYTDRIIVDASACCGSFGHRFQAQRCDRNCNKRRLKMTTDPWRCDRFRTRVRMTVWTTLLVGRSSLFPLASEPEAGVGVPTPKSSISSPIGQPSWTSFPLHPHPASDCVPTRLAIPRLEIGLTCEVSGRRAERRGEWIG